MMKVKVNSVWQEFHDQQRLQDALDQMEVAQKAGIAVAVNSNVVPRSEWPHYLLQENDEVIIITAAQGG